MPFTMTKQPHQGGVRKLFKFSNGLQASVIKTPFSYGGPEGLWELAVLNAEDRIITDSIFNNDDGVIGWLDSRKLAEALIKIDTHMDDEI